MIQGTIIGTVTPVIVGVLPDRPHGYLTVIKCFFSVACCRTDFLHEMIRYVRCTFAARAKLKKGGNKIKVGFIKHAGTPTQYDIVLYFFAVVVFS